MKPNTGGVKPLAEQHKLEEILEQEQAPPSPNSDTSTEDQSEPRPWLSFWLRPYTLLAMIVITLAMIGAITWLTIRSRRYQGFVSLQDIGTSTGPIPLVGVVDIGRIALTWTLVPTLLMTVYSACFGATTKAACARQPFIELRRSGDDGAAAETSILLDYNGMDPVSATIWSSWYGHWVVAVSTVLGQVLTLFTVPVVAALFQVTTIPASRNVSISQTVDFDGAGFGPGTDVVPILDVVAATLIYNGTAIPWTTANASLLPLNANELAPDQSANLTSTTSTRSIHLDCQVLDSVHYSLKVSEDSYYFSAEDRGCSISGQPFSTVPGGFAFEFAETFYTSCSLEAHWSRIMLAAALAEDEDSTKFSNVTVVSCIPTYSKGYVDVTLGLVGPGTAPVLRSTTPINNTVEDYPPLSAASFEELLTVARNYYDLTDHSQDSALGKLILQFARLRWPEHSYFSGGALNASTQAVVTAAFNVMVQQNLVVPAANPTSIPATLLLPQKRLAVLPLAAWILVGCLAAAVLMLAATCYYEAQHVYIQSEDSEALVGAAALLADSQLMMEASHAKRHRHDGRVGSKLARTMPREGGWKFSQWSPTRDATIEVTTKAREKGWFGSKKLQMLFAKTKP